MEEVQDGWRYSSDPAKLSAWWQREVDRERERADKQARFAASNLAMSRDYQQKWQDALRQHDIIRQKANARTTLDALEEVHAHLKEKFTHEEFSRLSKYRREGAAVVVEYVRQCVDALKGTTEK